MRAILLVACLLASAAFAQTMVSGTLGTAVSVQSDTSTEISFGAGPTLLITTSGNAEVTVSLFVQADVSIGDPEGFVPLAFTGNAAFGYEIEVSGGSITTAQLTTPALTTAALALITGSTEVGAARFDTEAEAWTAVNVEPFSLLDTEIVMEVPTTGRYAFFAVSVDSPVPTLYAEARATASGVASTFSFPSGFQLTFEGEATGSAEGTITVTRSDSPDEAPEEPADNHFELFLQLEAQAQTVTEATLEYTYDAAALASANIDVEADLAFAFYDTNSSSWVVETSSSVDVNAKVVTAITTHFSEWTVVEAGSTAAGAAAVSVLLLAVAALVAVAM